MDPSLDRVLAYRNLLCAEDHLDELRAGVGDSEELEIMEGMKRVIVQIRDQIMPEEKVPKWHCVAKHVCTAYEAMREVAKASGKEEDEAQADMLRMLMIRVLSALWAREIENCGRCKADDRGDTSTGVDSGLAGRTIQAIGED